MLQHRLVAQHARTLGDKADASDPPGGSGQFHSATRAKSSLFSAAAVTRNLEMPFQQITDGPNILSVQKIFGVCRRV